MTTKIKVTNRMLMKNGDYIEIITDGKVVYTFDNHKVAKNFFNQMKKASKKSNDTFSFDGNNNVIRICPNLSEKEIFDNEKKSIEFAIKNKPMFLKIAYEIFEL